MDKIAGEVRWYHVARSRAVRRIIEKSIARWAELQRIRTEASEARYQAVLQREGEGHLVHCQIEIVSGAQSWSGSRIGQGLQQALSECLAHMTPRSTNQVLPEPQPLT